VQVRGRFVVPEAAGLANSISQPENPAMKKRAAVATSVSPQPSPSPTAWGYQAPPWTIRNGVVHLPGSSIASFMLA